MWCVKLFEYCTRFHLGKPATSKHVLLILHKISNITRKTKHVNKRKKGRKARHASENNLPCVTTMPEHRPGANRANTVYIILKGLGLESQQKISSSKLLCCCHSNHYISRTLGLCSSLLGGYCSTQASFARASASYPPLTPIPHTNHQHYQITNIRKHILTQKITHYTFFSRTQLLRHPLTRKAYTTLTYILVQVEE